MTIENVQIAQVFFTAILTAISVVVLYASLRQNKKTLDLAKETNDERKYDWMPFFKEIDLNLKIDPSTKMIVINVKNTGKQVAVVTRIDLRIKDVGIDAKIRYVQKLPPNMNQPPFIFKESSRDVPYNATFTDRQELLGLDKVTESMKLELDLSYIHGNHRNQYPYLCRIKGEVGKGDKNGFFDVVNMESKSN